MCMFYDTCAEAIDAITWKWIWNSVSMEIFGNNTTYETVVTCRNKKLFLLIRRKAFLF